MSHLVMFVVSLSSSLPIMNTMASVQYFSTQHNTCYVSPDKTKKSALSWYSF